MCLSSFTSRSCLNYAFVIISQVSCVICFPLRSALDISILNSFIYYPLKDMHLSEAPTLALTVSLKCKGLRMLLCCSFHLFFLHYFHILLLVLWAILCILGVPLLLAHNIISIITFAWIQKYKASCLFPLVRLCSALGSTRVVTAVAFTFFILRSSKICLLHLHFCLFPVFQ